VTDVSLAVAFAAGVLSFISPCVLALLPVYLAFLGTAAVTGPAPRAAPAAPAAPGAPAAILPQAALFIGGFSLVFVVVGTSIGLVGAPLFGIPEIRQIAGIAVIVVGVLTTGIVGPVMDRFSIGVDAALLPTTGGLRAAALGALVAVGWTPCIGPVLGAIFTMGASSGSAPAVALLLTAYSLGLAVPFLAAALFFPRMRPFVELLRRHHVAVRVVTGLLIIGIGVLIYLNAFARLATLFVFVL
jgi:cytochrome c-type biogenesis protein